MPIYAYRCDECGHELDALQRISDPPLTDCPACGAAALKKQITAAAFRLKGAGWYETDFKKDGKKNLHEPGDDKPKDKVAEGEKKTDKKTDSESVKKLDKGGDKPTPAKTAATPTPKAAAE